MSRSLALFPVLTTALAVSAAVTPNKILTRGLTPYGSPSSSLTSLNDGVYGYGWAMAANSWAAYHLASSPSSVVVAWNNPSYTWSDTLTQQGTNHSSCVQGANLTYPSNYQILTSSNSTDGSDGTWTSRLTVTGNQVSSRSHVVTTGGDTWIKLAISVGSGQLDEFNVYDASNGSDDTWLFVGTSISANTYKSTPPAQDFAKLVEAAVPANTPVMVKAGIPCITSTDVSRNLKGYLSYGSNNHFWAIEMGTNDAWGGSAYNVSTYRNALQAIIDSAKAHGIQPMIARLLATNATAAGWQVNQAFLDTIDSLTSRNHLVAGPDLYTYFLAHPTELNSDGVHPNATGAASIEKLWADAMVKTVYAGATAVRSGSRPVNTLSVRPFADGWQLDCGSAVCSSVDLVGLDGRTRALGATDRISRGALPAGTYRVRATTSSGLREGWLVRP
jgi:lysophospholipase L1-like esterase